MQYRRKPVVVEAFRWLAPEPVKDPVWIAEAIERGEVRFVKEGTPEVAMVIRTSTRDFFATLGDWIVRGPAGNIYPVKAEDFPATYERAD